MHLDRMSAGQHVFSIHYDIDARPHAPTHKETSSPRIDPTPMVLDRFWKRVNGLGKAPEEIRRWNQLNRKVKHNTKVYRF